MKKFNPLKLSIIVLSILGFVWCGLQKIEEKAAMINHFEQVSLKLAKENRELHAEVKRLEFELEKLRQERSYYNTQLGHSTHGEEATEEVANHETKHEEKSSVHGRGVASVAPSAHTSELKKDFVEFKTYKWHADDMLKIADKEFKEKNYEKAAQFYSSLISNYPKHKSFNDEFYFKAGIAAYESGEHHEWAIDHFETLMSHYPTSEYYRSAKLWKSLTYLKMGDKEKVFATVEEFRKKYRNTKEWKILSSYYEKIEEKTNE